MNLLTAQCTPKLPALTAEALPEWLSQVPGWTQAISSYNEPAIECHFAFKNYYQTMAFVNAVAEIAHAQDHHPDMQVSYGGCTVLFNTHSAHGLTVNDFICAAQVSALPESNQ